MRYREAAAGAVVKRRWLVLKLFGLILISILLWISLERNELTCGWAGFFLACGTGSSFWAYGADSEGC